MRNQILRSTALPGLPPCSVSIAENEGTACGTNTLRFSASFAAPVRSPTALLSTSISLLSLASPAFARGLGSSRLDVDLDTDLHAPPPLLATLRPAGDPDATVVQAVIELDDDGLLAGMFGEPADRPPAVQALLDSLRQGDPLFLSGTIAWEPNGKCPGRRVTADLTWVTHGGDGAPSRVGSIYRQRLGAVLSERLGAFSPAPVPQETGPVHSREPLFRIRSPDPGPRCRDSPYRPLGGR